MTKLLQKQWLKMNENQKVIAVLATIGLCAVLYQFAVGSEHWSLTLLNLLLGTYIAFTLLLYVFCDVEAAITTAMMVVLCSPIFLRLAGISNLYRYTVLGAVVILAIIGLIGVIFAALTMPRREDFTDDQELKLSRELDINRITVVK